MLKCRYSLKKAAAEATRLEAEEAERLEAERLAAEKAEADRKAAEEKAQREAEKLAAEAAANQGQFDAMADLLFTNQDDWESLADPTSVFETYATQLGLDLTTFQTDSTDATIDQGITDDFDEAVGLGATGTPTFFLAGQQIAPPASEAEFEGLIQAEIDAIDEVFTVNRETGEIVVLDASLIVPSTTVNLPVLIKDLDDSEVVTVQIEIGALSAVQTSSLAIDTALAEDTDWRL